MKKLLLHIIPLFSVLNGLAQKDEDYYFGIDAPATLNLNFGFGSSARSGSKSILANSFNK